jgi:hypothetical protein
MGMTVAALWGNVELTALDTVVNLHTLSSNNHSVVHGILVHNTWYLFQCLTLPSRANKVFPYHVRTTQVGVMQVQQVTDPDSTFPFSHHQYAPSAPPRPCPNMQPLVGEWVTDVPFELFTVSHSVTTDPVSASYLSVITANSFFTHWLDTSQNFFSNRQPGKDSNVQSCGNKYMWTGIFSVLEYKGMLVS